MSDDLELAYFAGAVDADGWITILRQVRGKSQGTTHHEVLGLAQVTPTVPYQLCARFGGIVHIRKRPGTSAKNWRTIYYWQVLSIRATMAVTCLRPYLRVKAAQADILIELRRSLDRPWQQRRTVPIGVRARGLDPAVQAERAALYERVRLLNHNGEAPLVL